MLQRYLQVLAPNIRVLESPTKFQQPSSITSRTSMASSEDISRTFSAQGPSLEVHHILQHGPLPTQRQPSSSSTASSTRGIMKGKKTSAAENLQSNRPKAHSSSSRNTQSSSSTRAENRFAQREVRTLPR